MRTLFNIFSIAMFFLLAGCQQKAVVPLSFYIVSDEKVDDGQFIDTPAFPKLGYIHAAPDLVISKIESVAPNTFKGQAIMIDTNGKRTVEPMQEKSALDILMQPDDAKKFSTFTEQVVGKRILIMLGNAPLIAPRIMAPIETPSLQLDLGQYADE